MKTNDRIKELARVVFSKMVNCSMTRGLALARIEGVNNKNVLMVNDEVDILLRKWRGELL